MRRIPDNISLKSIVFQAKMFCLFVFQFCNQFCHFSGMIRGSFVRLKMVKGMLVKCFCNCTVIIFLLRYQFKQTTFSFILLDFFVFVIKYGLFFLFLFCFLIVFHRYCQIWNILFRNSSHPHSGIVQK